VGGDLLGRKRGRWLMKARLQTVGKGRGEKKGDVITKGGGGKRKRRGGGREPLLALSQLKKKREDRTELIME